MSAGVKSVAVVGAGLAGVACAAELSARGAAVRLFDKGRTIGGRLAQRRTPQGVFDHGAQYLSASDEGFRRLVAAWAEMGRCAPWPGVTSASGAPVVVGTPAMSAPVRALLGTLPVASQTVVTTLRQSLGGWWLELGDRTEAGPFDAVVVAIPAPQAAALLQSSGLIGLTPEIENVRMAPCWAGLATYVEPTGRDGAIRLRAEDGLIWAARNDTKPGRGGIESWTFHAGPGWSQRCLEIEPAVLAPRFAALVNEALGASLARMATLTLHRWRYALVTRPLGRPFLLLADGSLGLCGDWCLGPRVESAWLSGRALGRALPW